MKALRGLFVVMLGSVCGVGTAGGFAACPPCYRLRCGASMLRSLSEWPIAPAITVTLVSFTATTITGQPEVYIQWETAAEFDVAGFYVARS